MTDHDQTSPTTDDPTTMPSPDPAAIAEIAETNSDESTSETAVSASNGPAIAATDLSHAFGDVGVLGGVSLSVASGKVIALIGPNGSGKSVFLQFLARVRVPGKRAATVGSAESGGGRAHVGYLSQRPDFRADFSVADTLDFYAQFAGEDVDMISVLECASLADATDRRVNALSGGMTRLLDPGQALVGDPTVVVLDEPASGLDPGMVERLFDIVSDLVGTGVATVPSSHNLDPVERTADRVAILDGGRFVADDGPRTVVESVDTVDLQTALSDPVATEEVTGR